jgi:hypothetical protein
MRISGVALNALRPDEVPSGMRGKEYEAMTIKQSNLYKS